MSDHKLIVRNVRKVYAGNGEAVEALRGVNFDIEEGEFALVAGPSGSGKSTLLNLIGLLDTPTDGHIIVDGLDTTRLSESRRTQLRNGKIGFVFQFFNLIPELTVIENVMLPRLIGGTPNDKAKEEAAKLLKMVGLRDKIFAGATQLSGGQMQRVAVARALVNQPAIILADEPTGNLDSKNAEEIIDLMHELNKSNKQTFIMVTHAPELMGDVDKVIRIKDGLIEKIDTKAA
ncbi:MAG: ABC transporter ATP-binding protein [Thaumarchaeota archaeon]|nr:ABC transporter ATP-binding protein [Nitrososphaerota archaeon]